MRAIIKDVLFKINFYSYCNAVWNIEVNEKQGDFYNTSEDKNKVIPPHIAIYEDEDTIEDLEGLLEQADRVMSFEDGRRIFIYYLD